MGVTGWMGRLLGLADQADEDVRAELRFHMEERVEDLVARGVGEAEARRRVESEFGDVARIESETRRVARERARRSRWSVRLEALHRDLIYAVRLLVRAPGFTAASVATLGLGIGATTAVFTVVDSVLIRPLPYPDSDRLVAVWETQPAHGRYQEPTSPPNFVDIRDAATSFTALAAWEDVSVTVRTGTAAEVLDAAGVSGRFFDVLGVPAAVGRTLGPDDRGDAVVISHGYWRRRYGSAPDILGRTIQLEGGPAEIVGVLPPGFAAPSPDTELWYRAPIDTRSDHRASRYLLMLGRLTPGASRETAEAELRTIADRLGREYPATNQGWGLRLMPARDQVVGSAGELLAVLLGAVGLLLLLATVNVANMLLGRAATRERELAIRSALGASRGRIRWQLLVEGGLLGLLAGGVGVALAGGGVNLLLRLEPDAIPRAGEVAVDYRVLGFAGAVTIGASILVGLLPGRRAGVGPGRALGQRGGSGGRDRMRRALVVTELALSVMLMTGAGLLFQSFLRLRATDPGYATSNVLAAKVDLDDTRYPGKAARVTYFQTLLDRVREVPGVESAGLTTTMPLDPTGIDFALAYSRPGDPPVIESELPEVPYRIVSPGYIGAMGIRLIRGRDFDRTDRSDSRAVVLINEAFAEVLWPEQDPLGRRVTVHYIQDGGIDWEVVGLVENTRHSGLAAPAEPQLFVPMTQAEWLFDYMTLVVGHNGNAAALPAGLREATLSVDPQQPLFQLQTIQALRAADTARTRLAAALLGLFAALALVLAVVGVYGVVAYQVARRTRELGVRMAVGASRSGVIRMIVGETAGLAGIGLVLGLGGTAATARLMGSLLHGVEAFDPATYSAGAGLLFLAALLSAALPARRAARLDPVRSLRPD